MPMLEQTRLPSRVVHTRHSFLTSVHPYGAVTLSASAKASSIMLPISELRLQGQLTGAQRTMSSLGQGSALGRGCVKTWNSLPNAKQ